MDVCSISLDLPCWLVPGFLAITGNAQTVHFGQKSVLMQEQNANCCAAMLQGGIC